MGVLMNMKKPLPVYLTRMPQRKLKKVLRGNHKPHLNKDLRKAIMERSRLKNKAKKSKQPTDSASY